MPWTEITRRQYRRDAELEREREIEKLHAKIGQLSVERDLFGQEVRKMSAPDRTTLLACGHPTLSIRRQCWLLGLARSGVYRAARTKSDREYRLPLAPRALQILDRAEKLSTGGAFVFAGRRPDRPMSNMVFQSLSVSPGMKRRVQTTAYSTDQESDSRITKVMRFIA